MSGDARLRRQEALRELVAAAGLDGLIVTHLPNIRYLTGFTGSAGVLLVEQGRTVLVSDFRYAVQAEQEVGAVAAVEIDRNNVWERLRRVVEMRQPEALGIEAHALTVREAERIGGQTRCRIVPTCDLVERLRASKSAGEVDAIRAAAELAQDALSEVLPTVRSGQRELDVAARLEAALRLRGSEWHPFQTIVASGPRSALPHARTTERVLQGGEWLLLDFGAQVDGYCADLTRTVAIGRADERQREIYEIVRTAQERARAHVRAGMTGREADALARDIIAARGHGDAFGHSLGHGLGLEVHEAPRLAATNEVPLRTGAVVTIEPGIYLPGWGGVRLEDDVHLGASGPELLSDGRTELIELS